MNVLRVLDNGLQVRRSCAADAEKLAEFNGRIHGDDPLESSRVGVWTRDLLDKPHPTFDQGDFTIVEEISSGKVVSSLNLIPQTWSYAGIPFKVGRPELVGTDPEYRGRGLVRAQFEIIHQWSKERGQLVQGITGIPYYYRLFGYEMALNLGGGRVGYAAQVPQLEADKSEPYRIRPALEADLPFIAALYEQNRTRALVSAVWDLSLWKYELSGKSPENIDRHELRVIETAAGEALGFLAHPFFLWGSGVAAKIYELKAGVSWYAVTPSVVRYLWQTGQEYARAAGKEANAFQLGLGASHPAYEVFSERLPRQRSPYAWYLRVADLPGFMRLIAPVLEERLAGSPCCGYTGEMTLGFYRDGLKLAFADGKLASAEAWQPTPKDFGKVTFPPLTFLQLLFGYRTLDELTYAFPDCYAGEDLKPILRVLFPKKDSDVWMVS